VAGIAGPGTALILVFGPPALIVIVAWLLVAWSRTVLQQHTLFQTLLGILLGASITVGTYLVLYFPLL
jgi:membrane-associated phospholipid phosphatase